MTAARSDKSDVWLRIYAIRTLIRLGHFDRAVLVSIIRSDSIPAKLEVLRILGYLREKSIIPELEALVVNIDKVVKAVFEVYVFSTNNFKIESFDLVQIDARRNREIEEVVKTLGSIGEPAGLAILKQVFDHERTYRERSYELLISCVNALGNIGTTTATEYLEEVSQKLSHLVGPTHRVQNAIDKAYRNIELTNGGTVYKKIDRSSGYEKTLELVNAREDDDFELFLLNILEEHLGEWLRGPNSEVIEEFMIKVTPHLTSVHFHNTPPYLHIGGWRTDPRIQERFSVEGYPDDLQVWIHDGGPQMTNHPPELVYVRVTGYAGDLYRGRVLNKPHQLQTVKEGDLILFAIPENGKWPFYIKEKYLEERADWHVNPCGKCGSSMLFDAPSDLIRIQFQFNIPPSGNLFTFTTRCIECGDVLVLKRIKPIVDQQGELT